MAFRKHNPNLVGPLQSNETWKVNPSKSKQASSTGYIGQDKASNNEKLLDIDTLIAQFDHITVGKENPIRTNDGSLNISKRLSDLHDSSKRLETIGGDLLPLSASKKEPIVSPELPKRDSSYSFLANEQGRFSSDATNDRLPSFRLHDPPTMKRTTSGSSSFPMHVLGRRKGGDAPSGQNPTVPTKPVANERLTMNYSLAARQYLPDANTKRVHTKHQDASQHIRKASAQVGDSEMQRKADFFNCQIRDLTSKRTVKSAEEAELVLRSMISKYNGHLHKVRPNGFSYNSVIHAYASLGMPSQAEKILFLMFEDWQRGNDDAEPNVRIFTSVLKAWQRAKTRESPLRCEHIIEAMNELSSNSRLLSCQPDVYAMTVLMHSWVDSPCKHVAEKVDRIFRTMKRKYNAGDMTMKPDCIVYSLVLNAHVREFSIKKAEATLWEMVDDFLAGNKSAMPRVRNFNTVLAMYARSGQLHAPDRAEAVVAKFRDLCTSRKLPLKPDAYTYSQLLKTWVTSGRKDAIDKAVICFYWMKKLGEHGDKAATPDAVKYSTIICAYTNVGDYQQARSMLEVMTADYLSGNTLAFPEIALYDRLVVCCLAGVGKRNLDPLKAADAIITELWCLSESIPKLRPTMKMYTIVIQKHVEMKNPARAHALLMDLLVTRHRVVGNPAISLCNSVLKAWEVSKHPSKKSYMFRIRVAMFEVNK